MTEEFKQMALSFRNVSKVYETTEGGSREVLVGVNFDISLGQSIAIVGRSGTGKSTLLNLAAGIDVPSRGEVDLFGQTLSDLGDEERTILRRDHVGLIFQFFHLMPHLTVKDNVALPAMIAGEKPATFQPRVDRLLDRVGLGDRGNDRVQKLSGGEMQRVAICRALLRSPRLLLADEPTGNLDDENAGMIMDLLFTLAREEGMTLVYVTHSQAYADLADEVWEISRGKIEQEAERGKDAEVQGAGEQRESKNT